jgi:hypothetical protein
MATYDSLNTQFDASYYHQAKKSLVMLSKIRNIEFRIRQGCEIPEAPQEVWSVRSSVSPPNVPSKSIDLSPLKCVEFSEMIISAERVSYSEREVWVVCTGWISIASIVPLHLRNYAVEENLISSEPRIRHNIPDIAIAAKLSNTMAGEHSYYNSLPLQENTGFPVSLHSRFAVTPDRRSLRLEDKGGDWNRFLASACFPTLYFFMLEKLAQNPKDEPMYYTYWPNSTSHHNEISQCLQTAFWHQLPASSRSLFPSGKLRTSISGTIFDVRNPIARAQPDSVLGLVQALRPEHVVVTAPNVLRGLVQLRSCSNEHADGSIAFLDSAYVRGLLCEDLAESITNTKFTDAELNNILNFSRGTDSLETLDGCWVLRLDDGRAARLQIRNKDQPQITKVYYVVDTQGYNLLKDIIPGSLVNPFAFGTDISKLNSLFNIQRLDGSAIDLLLEAKLKVEPIKRFTSEDGDWLNRLSRYISSKGFVVHFYNQRPTLPLSNTPDTFISFEACDTLPIMPPLDRTVSLLNIAKLLPDLHILANEALQYKPLAAKVRTWHVDERFLECLYRMVNGNCIDLQSVLKERLREMDFMVQYEMNLGLIIAVAGNLCKFI